MALNGVFEWPHGVAQVDAMEGASPCMLELSLSELLHLVESDLVRHNSSSLASSSELMSAHALRCRNPGESNGRGVSFTR